MLYFRKLDVVLIVSSWFAQAKDTAGLANSNTGNLIETDAMGQAQESQSVPSTTTSLLYYNNRGVSPIQVRCFILGFVTAFLHIIL